MRRRVNISPFLLPRTRYIVRKVPEHIEIRIYILNDMFHFFFVYFTFKKTQNKSRRVQYSGFVLMEGEANCNGGPWPLIHCGRSIRNSIFDRFIELFVLKIKTIIKFVDCSEIRIVDHFLCAEYQSCTSHERETSICVPRYL